MDVKNQSGFKKQLLAERQRILNATKKSLNEDLSVSIDDLPDEADQAAVDIQQNLTFQLRDRERKLLENINLALQRIDDGSYGICEETEEPIELERLKAVPWTTLSLVGAEMRENRRKRFA